MRWIPDSRLVEFGCRSWELRLRALNRLEHGRQNFALKELVKVIGVLAGLSLDEIAGRC